MMTLCIVVGCMYTVLVGAVHLIGEGGYEFASREDRRPAVNRRSLI